MARGNLELEPADLEMHVQIQEEIGGKYLQYRLHSPSGSANFAHKSIRGPKLKKAPETLHDSWRQRVQELAS